MYLRRTASTIGTALNKAHGTDAFLHVLFAAGETGDRVATQGLGRRGTNLGRPDQTQVATAASHLATFALVLVTGAATSSRFGSDRQAARMANTETVAGTLTAAFNVLEVTGCYQFFKWRKQIIER